MEVKVIIIVFLIIFFLCIPGLAVILGGDCINPIPKEPPPQNKEGNVGGN